MRDTLRKFIVWEYVPWKQRLRWEFLFKWLIWGLFSGEAHEGSTTARGCLQPKNDVSAGGSLQAGFTQEPCGGGVLNLGDSSSNHLSMTCQFQAYMCVTLSPGSATRHRWVFGKEGVSERPTHLRSLVLPPGVNSVFLSPRSSWCFMQAHISRDRSNWTSLPRRANFSPYMEALGPISR